MKMYAIFMDVDVKNKCLLKMVNTSQLIQKINGKSLNNRFLEVGNFTFSMNDSIC